MSEACGRPATRDAAHLPERRHGWLAPALFLAAMTLNSQAMAGPEPLPVSGQANVNLASFDRLMTDFVQKHEVPGATLAVVKNGRLVYARGFGYADRPRREAMEARSLMRIASVSKPITAAAILLLVQQGKLKLTDHAWDLLRDLEKGRPASAHFDARWRQVTILELLQHRGGWDQDRSYDPMFRPLLIANVLQVPPPAQARDVVRYMMGQPLDFDPGQRHAYSNFGYCVLGRVIEAVSGQRYEQFVARHVFAPLGIQDMRIGKTLASERAAGEAAYHVPRNPRGLAVVGPERGKLVLLPYGTWYHEALDAHGGWIGSAPDLVRFASSLDRAGPPGLLGVKSLKTLFARPPGEAGFTKQGKPRDVFYACGWEVRPMGAGRANTWHNGLLPGSESLLVRRADGLAWAVLFNTSDDGKLVDTIDPLLHEAADQVRSWPKGPERNAQPPR